MKYCENGIEYLDCRQNLKFYRIDGCSVSHVHKISTNLPFMDNSKTRHVTFARFYYHKCLISDWRWDHLRDPKEKF